MMGIVAKFRQFGFRHFLRRACLASLRPILRYEEFYVLISERRNLPIAWPDGVEEVSRDRLSAMCSNGLFAASEVLDVEMFLGEGCRCVGAFEDEKIAGYAWIQPSGTTYSYGFGGKMRVPDGFVLMKNLLVRPAHRERGHGQRLNQARLSLVAADQTAAVFIVKDNKVALANWLRLGFRPMLTVSQRRFFKGPVMTTVTLIAECVGVQAITTAIKRGVQDESLG